MQFRTNQNLETVTSTFLLFADVYVSHSPLSTGTEPIAAMETS